MAARPGSVTFVAVLTYLNGILTVIGGAIMLFTSDSMARASGGSAAGIITAAIISILLGVVTVVVARGLLTGSAVARVIVAVVMVIDILNGVLQMFTLQFVSGIIQILWSMLILSLLFTPRANRFFATH